MTSKPRRQKDRTEETHVYMTKDEKKALQVQAFKESRSVNGQILHYIRSGLEGDGVL
jgi:hypothetical protein